MIKAIKGDHGAEDQPIKGKLFKKHKALSLELSKAIFQPNLNGMRSEENPKQRERQL